MAEFVLEEKGNTPLDVGLPVNGNADISDEKPSTGSFRDYLVCLQSVALPLGVCSLSYPSVSFTMQTL